MAHFILYILDLVVHKYMKLACDTHLCDGRIDFSPNGSDAAYARLVPKTKEEYVNFLTVCVRCIEYPNGIYAVGRLERANKRTNEQVCCFHLATH